MKSHRFSRAAALCAVVFAILLSASVRAATLHVWTNSPAPNPPYDAWTNAAATIQEAVDYAAANDTVLVTNGLYMLSSEITVNKDIVVLGIGNREDIVVDGNGACRCFSVDSPGAVIAGLTITRGWTDLSGGGVLLENGLLSNCVVSANIASNDAGGVYIGPGGIVENCAIVTNSAGFRGSGAFIAYPGGAIAASTISSNYGAYWGGGMFCDRNGRVSNCVFRANSAYQGGGLYLDEAATVETCLIIDNTASNFAAGVLCYLGGTILNCTITGNRSEGTGGGIGTTVGGRLRNTIIQSNSAAVSGDEYSGSGATYEYCCSTGLVGSGNIGGAPLFMDAGAGNYRLQPGSPCVDAGNNGLMRSTVDHDRIPRPLDGDTNGIAVVDIGCHEYINPFADSDHDLLLDTNEIYGVGTNPTRADTDGDRFGDYQEIRAGTDPFDPGSFLGIVDYATAGNQPAVQWSTVFNKSYWLQRCTNIIEGAWANVGASAVQELDESPEGTEFRIDSDAPSGTALYYRVRVE